MNLSKFLIIDTVALDIAGVAALIAGETALGIAFLALAAVAFTAVLARRRQTEAPA